jgi:hypothetical protein
MLEVMETLTVYKFREGIYYEMKRDFPWIRGIIFSTKSMIDLQNNLLIDKDYISVFTGHFTQDGVENLFSQLRSKIPDPTPYQAMSCLKKITLSKYMEEVPRASYEFTDGLFMLNIMEGVKEKKTNQSYELEILPLSNFHDQQILVYIYGASVFSVIHIQLGQCECKKQLMYVFTFNFIH